MRTFTTSWESLMRGKDTPLSEMIETFLMAKEAEGRSKRTIEQYTTYLGNFERWVGGGTVVKLTPEAATRYIAERRRRSPTIGRLSAADPPAVAIEVPSDVYVSVDEPRQKRHRPEVMGDSAGGRRNTFDLRSAYGDDNIPLYTATAVKNLRRTNRYRRVGLWHRHARCARERGSTAMSESIEEAALRNR